MTVKDFIQGVRYRVGDTGCDVIADDFIISYLNTVMAKMGFDEDMAPLFEKEATFELASLNEDGTRAVRWELAGDEIGVDESGHIFDIREVEIYLQDKGCIQRVAYCHSDGLAKCGLGENVPCGIPCQYTIERVGPKTFIRFDVSPSGPISIHMTFSAFPNRLTKDTDELPFPRAYMTLFEDRVVQSHKEEATDNDVVRSMWEDVDVLIENIRQSLHSRFKVQGYRRARRSW